MARRISGVGFVTVSLRMSMIAPAIVVHAPEKFLYRFTTITPIYFDQSGHAIPAVSVTELYCGETTLYDQPHDAVPAIEDPRRGLAGRRGRAARRPVAAAA